MKVAVLGCGKMGRNVIRHLRQFEEPLRILAFDTCREALSATREQTGAACTEHLDDVLDDPQVRLVFIAAANAAHHDLTIAALRAGKAVLCEKPMATTLEDAGDMVAEAEKSGAFLQIGFELRYSTLYTTVKDWIEAGRLGEVRHIQCNYICSEFWGPHSWRVSKQAGSMFGEKLSHYVDLPCWWTGCAVESVYAVTSPNVVPYFQVQDNYQASLKFEGGAVSHLTFMMPFASTSAGDPLMDSLNRQKDDGHELRYLIMGSAGGVETNVFHRFLKRWEYRLVDGKFQSELAETIRWEPEEDHFYFHNTTGQTWDVVRRMRDGLPPKTPARDSLATMRVCEAVELSILNSESIGGTGSPWPRFENGVRAGA